jgi:hypothetical protein
MEKQIQTAFNHRDNIGGPIEGQSRGVCKTFPKMPIVRGSSLSRD